MSEKKLNYFWCIGVFVLLPLAMTKGYSNITITKFIVYGIVTIICFYWMVLYRFFDYASTGNKGIKISIVEKLIIVYFVMNCITCVVSENMTEDIVAAYDKHMGLFYVLLTIMTYLTVRYIKLYDINNLIRLAAIGTCVTIVFAMIQFLGMDFGNILGRLAIAERGNFLSTMGNTAVFGKYCCIVCPVLIFLLWKSNARKDKLICILLSALYFVSILISNIDAAYLGFSVAIVSLFLLSLKYKYLNSYICTMESGFIGFAAFGILYRLLPNVRHLSKFGVLVVSNIRVEVILAIVVGFVIIVSYKKNFHISDRIGAILFKCTVGIVIVTVIGILLLFIYCSFINRTTNIGGSERYFRFSDDWGTQRGIIWRWCADIYTDLPVYKKLFGAGHGSVPILLLETYKTQMSKDLGFVFDNAHNVYLHQLVSTGIAGVVSYLAILIAAIVSGFRNKDRMIFTVGIIICMIMDIVCICEPITNPYLWILMAFACRPAEKI